MKLGPWYPLGTSKERSAQSEGAAHRRFRRRLDSTPSTLGQRRRIHDCALQSLTAGREGVLDGFLTAALNSVQV
jgi:methylphosphotriester-DNA--protein-cysteine methyltransferase